MTLRFAYNTNGLAHHRLVDAVDFLADTGYDGIALTLDHHHLDPFAASVLVDAERLRHRLDTHEMTCMIETGARFLLDPRHKHEPTLVTPSSEGRSRRLDFLRRAVDIAVVLDAETVSFWAGVPAVDISRTWPWLVDGVARLQDYAVERNVELSFEPEPGMVVEDCRQWERLRDDLTAATGTCELRLALDTGHCVVTGDLEPAEAVLAYGDELGTVAVEDMRRGVHEHLFFGEGDIDIAAVVNALEKATYDRLVTVELSRDSHRAHELVPRAIELLREAAA